MEVVTDCTVRRFLAGTLTAMEGLKTSVNVIPAEFDEFVYDVDLDHVSINFSMREFKVRTAV